MRVKDNFAGRFGGGICGYGHVDIALSDGVEVSRGPDIPVRVDAPIFSASSSLLSSLELGDTEFYEP